MTEGARSLKCGNSFVVFDGRGNIDPAGETGATQVAFAGLFDHGTRHLSDWRLTCGPMPMMALAAWADPLHAVLSFEEASARTRIGDTVLQPGAVRLSRTWTLADTLVGTVTLENYGPAPLALAATVGFDADFKDEFEVRGIARQRHGVHQPADVERDRVTLRYRGLDAETRRTRIAFEPMPASLSGDAAAFRVDLPPGGRWQMRATVTTGSTARHRIAPSASPGALCDERQATMNALLDGLELEGRHAAAIRQAAADVALLTTALPTGPYPYAGLPRFSTPFGRDAVITAMLLLPRVPDLAAGVLRFLAETQADDTSAERESAPGKILHEMRHGEMSALREVPYGAYYGGVDTTPLFIVLAGMYWRVTRDGGAISDIWPNLVRALAWMDGACDALGFLTYRRGQEGGLVNQGWKDSPGSVIHADGTPADGDIALVEVQGYAVAARRTMAELAQALALPDINAATERDRADGVQDAIAAHFWDGELGAAGCHGIALDGDGALCRVVSSNPGHLLFSGAVDPAQARALVATLSAPSAFSGWGVRTLAEGTRGFNPQGYHTGSVWPHDTALIARGMLGAGHADAARQLAMALLDAAAAMPDLRMPELFAGHARHDGAPPIPHPVSCAPQAWAAAAVIAMADLISMT